MLMEEEKWSKIHIRIRININIWSLLEGQASLTPTVFGRHP